jgi:streptogramin lyase
MIVMGLLAMAPGKGKSIRGDANDPEATSNVDADAAKQVSPRHLEPKPRNSQGQVQSAPPPPPAAAPGGRSRTYAHDADFDAGAIRNLAHVVPDQLQLVDSATPFDFLWVTVSNKGTIVKIDTESGKVLGEYRTAPAGQPTNPSRTSVDSWGNVWAGNRDDSSVVQVGLVENQQCIDRNRNGRIDTSTGLDDVLDWSNAGGLDTGGGVSTATDECILHYTIVDSSGTRHVSVTADDNVWVSGTGSRRFDLIDGSTGAILRREGSLGHGGYGGLIDGQGVIWSARPLMRWDPDLPLTDANTRHYEHDSYGLCVDSKGNVWNTALAGNEIRKFAPDGRLLATYSHGSEHAQSCAIDRGDHVWVAHSMLDEHDSVGHLLPDGRALGNVKVGVGPTAVAVDARGKIWVTNYHSQTVSRIDPMAGPIGSDGTTPVGAVDFTTADLGGLLYGYGDMSGAIVRAAPTTGTWAIVHDSGVADTNWGKVTWTQKLIGDGSIRVFAASSEDGVEFGPAEEVRDDIDLTVADGRFLAVEVVFARSTEGASPILYDLTIEVGNEPPDCSKATPSVARVQANRRKFVSVTIEGLLDPEADLVTVTITSIMQDQPVDTKGKGKRVPDGKGLGTPQAQVRAEHARNRGHEGRGRLYEIGFTASDPGGRSCMGSVRVGVARRDRETRGDARPKYDSTQVP